MLRAKESDAERYFRQSLESQHSVHLRKIPESTIEGRRTADYELMSCEDRLAVVEVKNLRPSDETEANGWTVDERDNGIRVATRRDNAPHRVGRLIRESWKQLCEEDVVRILAIVNDDPFVDHMDLFEAYNGFLRYGNSGGVGYRNVASSRVANGDIRSIKSKIDLYVWLDRARGCAPKFRITTERGYEFARTWFGCPMLASVR